MKFSIEGAIITGDNGSGKTNLLESICYCAIGKSLRLNSDIELIRFDNKFFRIDADFQLHSKELKVECAIDNKQKKIKINSTKLDKLSDLFKYIKVVYFSPNDVDIVSGSPLSRRVFLDQAISQYDFEYLQNLKIYNRILKQRNQLLKGNFSSSEKRSWDSQFTESADIIVKSRLTYLEKITDELSSFYKKISSNSEFLSNMYKYSFINKIRSQNYKDRLYEFITSNEMKEVEQQRTLAGPHLDDLDFFLDKKNARRYASQGQKRSIAIAVRLVQADMITINGEWPILMFDDVLAELDKGRTERILDNLKPKHQIFIATPKIEILQNRVKLPEIRMGI